MSGFHLTSPRSGQAADAVEVQAVGRALAAYPHRYYTCHCTGEGPFAQLRGSWATACSPCMWGSTSPCDPSPAAAEARSRNFRENPRNGRRFVVN